MNDTSANWVTFLAASDRRGGTSSARKTAPKELIWRVPLPDSVRSSPVLRDGVLYVTCRDGHLYAFEQASGTERWRFRAGAAIHSTPSLSEQLVYFGCDDGWLYAVDRSSGGLRWKAETGAAIWASPSINGNTVYVGS